MKRLMFLPLLIEGGFDAYHVAYSLRDYPRTNKF